MEIKTLIEVFEQLIPHYKKAVEEKYSDYQLRECNLNKGICNAAYLLLDKFVYELFYKKGHYCNLVNKHDDYLFPIGKPGLKKRLKFLQEQVVELNNLLKKGYTDV